MQYIRDLLSDIETDASIQTSGRVFEQLRRIGLNDFASVIWSMPDEAFPKISSLLPTMASEDTQRLWTGFYGYSLLSQSISFMRAMSANYAELSGDSLAGKRILDYGCGYGRLLRLAAFYSDDVHGVDPWPESIVQCRTAGIGNVSLSEYLPTSLPAPLGCDFAYAFSVFTHLSESATRAALSALHDHVKPGGILCITIRPVEYWRTVYADWHEAELAKREAEHHTGFTFYPHDWAAPNGDVTYGDTSMSLSWVDAISRDIGWKVEVTDRTIDDPVQRFVFLRRL